MAEHDKLAAEALKLNRDRVLSPWIAVVAVSGGIGGLIAGAQAVFRIVHGS